MISRKLQLLLFMILETYDKVHTLRSPRGITRRRTKSEPNIHYSEPLSSPKSLNAVVIECIGFRSNAVIELAENVMNGQIPVRTFTESSVSIFCSVDDLGTLMGLSVSMENMRYLSIYERFKPPRGFWGRLVNFFRRLFDILKGWRRRFKNKL